MTKEQQLLMDNFFNKETNTLDLSGIILDGFDVKFSQISGKGNVYQSEHSNDGDVIN